MTTNRFMLEQSAESKDEFDEQIHLPFYNNNNTKTNKKIKNSKHRPSPPQHSHNVTESTLTQSSYQSNTTLVTDPTTTTNTHINITPDQWRFIKHKMDNISSFIENNENVDNNHTKNHIDQSILLQKHDDIRHDNESDNGSDHISDDDVLLSDVITISTKPLNLTENQTISTLTTSNKQSHQYKQSIVQPFDPNGYDGVINALDVLQNFFNINEKGHNFDIESKNESDATNSDDEVLDRDFEKNNNHDRDPFDTDVSDESHDIISNHHYNNDNLHVKNKHSEYDKLAFHIANSTGSRSRSVQSNESHTGSKNTEKKSNNQLEKNMTEPINLIHKKDPNDKKTHKNPSGHHRVVTPIPVNRLKSKNKYRLKSPKSVNEEKSSTISGISSQIQIHDEQMAMVNQFKKKNTYSFSEILSEANKRNYNITPQSQYLMASTHLVIDHSKALSPSHSVQSQTEISVDNADEYDYRMMADGGCKRMSQSYGIPPVDSHNNNNNNNNMVGGSREISTVDIIMEEDEHDSSEKHNKHLHTHVHVKGTGDIGVLLKQPSMASVPSPPPPQAPIIDNIIRVNQVNNINALGPPVPVPVVNNGINIKSLRALSSHYDTHKHKHKHKHSHMVHNKRYNAVNKMDEDDEENDGDDDDDDDDDVPRTLITIQSIDSPQNYKYNQHQRDNSMVVEYDEQSAFQDDFVSTNYTPSNKQNKDNNNSNNSNNSGYSYHPFSPKNTGIKRAKKRLNKTLDLHERSEEISLVQTSQTKSNSKSKSKSIVNVVELEENEMKCNIRRAYTQYAVRSNIEKQALKNENNKLMGMNGEEHAHNMIIIHPENGDGDGDGHRRNFKSKEDNFKGDYIPFNQNKWTKWILLAALSICFILGVFMGFGVSWIFFVTD